MLEVKNVVIQYDQTVAVKDVSFTVADGEFFTLLGPSGCGKTTTLRAISGFEKASAGKILLDGRDIAPLSPEERDIGYVFQNYALFPSMSIFDNIAFGLKIRRVPKAEIVQRVQKIADMIEIRAHLHKKISQISGGQQQRVAIARALVVNPKLLLMDEPLSNLDAKLRISMRGEIKRIQRELGIVAIYVTHDQEEAMAISDRIAVFNQGVIEQIGTPQEVYDHPKTEFTAKFVGDINELTAETVSMINARSKIQRNGRGFIRTEKVQIAAADEIADGMCGCRGIVTGTEFLGATSKTRIRIGENQMITAMRLGGKAYEIGASVMVQFHPEDVLYLS